MSYREHFRDYDRHRTLTNIDTIYNWKHGNWFPPPIIEVSPTHKCNQKCRYCFTHNRGIVNESMSNEMLIDVYRQIADIGTTAVYTQGSGEPTLHKALPAAIETGYKLGLKIGITTNGVPFIPELQDKLLDKLVYVKISVMDNDPFRYAYVHGCAENQCNILINNIKNIIRARRERNLDLALWGTVYPSYNDFQTTYGIVRFFKELGWDYIVVSEAVYGDFSPIGKDSYYSDKVSLAEQSILRNKLMKLNDDDFKVKMRFPIEDKDFCNGVNPETFKKGYCQGIKFYNIITADGEILPCWRAWGNKDLSYGNIKEHTLEYILHSGTRRAVDDYILNNPPKGMECSICNPSKINAILDNCTQSNNWRGFLV